MFIEKGVCNKCFGQHVWDMLLKFCLEDLFGKIVTFLGSLFGGDVSHDFFHRVEVCPEKYFKPQIVVRYCLLGNCVKFVMACMLLKLYKLSSHSTLFFRAVRVNACQLSKSHSARRSVAHRSVG